MSSDLIALTVTAASIGLLHTLIGPDHYVPFIAMSRARGWSRIKTAWVTFLCGVGHVASSVVLGLIGIAVGIAVFKLENVESARGEIAGWLLTAFGFVYMVWGIRRAIRGKTHTHLHAHASGSSHVHEHDHEKGHLHPHDAKAKTKANITPWILFTIFVFGPCEPLIPILMYPAAKESLWGMLMVTLVFAVVTIGTMMTVVMAMTFGLSLLRFAWLERLGKYSHALAGAMLLACGLAIKFGL